MTTEWTKQDTLEQLSVIADKKRYVTARCDQDKYKETIDKAMKCKRVTRGHKPIAGTYSLKEMWMLHNALIDYAGKLGVVLARVSINGEVMDEWALVSIGASK